MSLTLHMISSVLGIIGYCSFYQSNHCKLINLVLGDRSVLNFELDLVEVVICGHYDYRSGYLKDQAFR